MTRWNVRCYALVPKGATREQVLKEWYLNAASARAAEDSADDILKNMGGERLSHFQTERVPDGVS